MMEGLHLYAILSEPPGSEPGTGVDVEPLSILAMEGFAVAVGAIEGRPRATPERLRRHDLAIRRLAPMVSSLLPCRFGEWAPDEASLERTLQARAERLRGMLGKVRDCSQMTLRVFGDRAELTPPVDPEASFGGPGTRYLRERRGRADTIDAVLAPVRERLGAWVRDERVELRPAGRLLASVYHLVPRGELAAYESALSELALRSESFRLAASGPWPPYAFVREGAP